MFFSLCTACLVWELSVIPALYCSLFRKPYHCTLSRATWIQLKHLQFPFSKTGYVLPSASKFSKWFLPYDFPIIIVPEFLISAMCAMRAVCPAHRMRVPPYCPRTQDAQPVSPSPIEIRSAVWRSLASSVETPRCDEGKEITQCGSKNFKTDFFKNLRHMKKHLFCSK